MSPMQTTTEHLSPEAAKTFLDALPEKIRLGLLTCASQLNYPVEAVVEMAIAGYLDEDSVSFVGCKPMGIDFGRKAS